MGWSQWILCWCGAAAMLPAQRAEARPLPSDPSFLAQRAVRLLELPARSSEAWRELLRLQQASAPPLAAALGDPRPEVAIRAAFVLGQLGEAAQAVAPQVRQRALTAAPDVAVACRWALHRIETRQTLLVDYMAADIVVLGPDGAVQRTVRVKSPWHAQTLPDGHLLYSEYGQNRLVEIDAAGKEVWSFQDLNNPLRFQRLPDGHTLIADSGGHRVIEVDGSGKVVLELPDFKRPSDVDRYPDGHTLITDAEAGLVVELDAAGQVVWEFRGCERPMDADRLPNGNTLIAASGGKEVLEVDRRGAVLARIGGVDKVHDACRLPNGHTLVAATGAFLEFDAEGVEVWRRVGTYGCHIERQ